MSAANPHKELAQARKATSLALVIGAAGGSAASARAMPAEGWTQAAIVAEVHPPSTQVQARVVEILEAWEKAAGLRDGRYRATSSPTISPGNGNGNFKNHPQKEGTE